jgi:glutathione synthase/RimK-type ligase-like ATP-grasp enzyme
VILIVSFADNLHVQKVVEHLTMDHAIVDVAWFPSRMRLIARTGAEVDTLEFGLPEGRRLALDRVGAVWYRRIRPMTVDPALADETARLFAWSEANEALLGVWYAMRCFWMNPPLADEAALRKIHQLRIARRAGLAIPETLVTNSPDEARDFVGRHGAGQVIRKAFRNIAQAPRETALVTERELGVLDSVRFAPVIFQAFVPARLDLRVTVVGGEIFAASIASDAAYGVDYRPGLASAEVRPYRLPDPVAERLLALMAELGLAFGAVDFRVTPEGEHVFLEVNPAGEYLFISERTGLPIPQAIAATLEREARRRLGA